jgi:hypothetical protein
LGENKPVEGRLVVGQGILQRGVRIWYFFLFFFCLSHFILGKEAVLLVNSTSQNQTFINTE